MDCGGTDRRVACWTSDEGWWLPHSRLHSSRHPRRHPGWLGVWGFGNLARRRHDRLHHCGICWCGHFGRDYSCTEESLIVELTGAYVHDPGQCIMKERPASGGRDRHFVQGTQGNAMTSSKVPTGWATLNL